MHRASDLRAIDLLKEVEDLANEQMQWIDTNAADHRLSSQSATFGPAAAFSEHHRADYITYTSAEGPERSGGILWVCAPTDKYYEPVSSTRSAEMKYPGSFANGVNSGVNTSYLRGRGVVKRG